VKQLRYKALKTRLYLNKDEHDFLLYLMRASKNLYNEALYNVRQHFFNTRQYLTYNENYHVLKDSENYRILNTSLGQAVIQKADEAMKAFFGSIKVKSSQKVRLPGYLKKDAYYSLIDRAVYKPSNKYYQLPRGNFIKKVSKLFKVKKKLFNIIDSLDIFIPLNIRIKTPKCIINKQIKEITIKPQFDGQYIEVIHTYLDEDVLELVNEKINTMGIDLGFNNLAFCALTNNNHLLLDGNKLKSMNQWYHKRMSELSSKRPNQKVLTKQMIRLMIKRNNQMAKSIPLARLRDKISYLAKEQNIEVSIVNESYTSKASYIDNDEIPELDYNKHQFSGKRVKRGLYRSKEGILINADLNAALNILRKGKPDAERIGNRGWNTPKRTYLFG